MEIEFYRRWADAQDWSKGIKAVADANGFTYQAVYRVVKMLGIVVHSDKPGPKPGSKQERRGGKRGVSAFMRVWAENQEWGKGYAHVAKESGLDYMRVWARAKALGITAPPSKRGPKPGTPASWKRKLPIDIDIDFTKSDTELARQHNVSRERIRQLRKAAGVSKVGRKEQ